MFVARPLEYAVTDVWPLVRELLLRRSIMKTKQAPTTQFQNIDINQLEGVTGGCACGCGQANCNCANGSCGGGAAAQQRPFSWGR